MTDESPEPGAAVLSVARTVACVDVLVGPNGREYRKAWAAAVVSARPPHNESPFLNALAQLGEQLGGDLTRRALESMSCSAADCLSYGKGAIVGDDCDLEYAAALLHPRLGRPLRKLLGKGKALIPSTIKRGAAGARLDVPLHGADDEWDFSLLDAVEVFVPGAPRRDEIVVAIALAAGGRPRARVVDSGST